MSGTGRRPGSAAGRRRVVRPATGGPPGAGQPGRSLDDTDLGWGADQEPAQGAEHGREPGRDPVADHLLRERPPHWG